MVASLGRNAQADLRQILQPYQNTRVEEDHLGDQESGNDSQEVEKVIIMDQGHKPEIPFLSEEEASAGNHASSAEAPALKKPLYSRTIDRDESKLTEERVSTQVKTLLHLVDASCLALSKMCEVRKFRMPIAAWQHMQQVPGT